MANRRDGILSVGELNVNSLMQRKNELDIILTENNVDVMLINDSRMNDGMNARFNNYNAERSDHPSNSRRPGGVMVLVRNDLIYNRLRVDVKESVVVDLEYGSKCVRICTTYLHPGEWFDLSLMNQLMANSTKVDVFLICGDMNARVGLEIDKGSDRKGQFLLNVMDNASFSLLNTSEPTYYSDHSDCSSCLDLAFLKTNDSNIETRWRTLPPCSSDHVPTLVEIKCRRGGFMNEGSSRLEFKKVDWERYGRLVDENMEGLSLETNTVEGAENLVKKIGDILNRSREESTTKIKARKNGDVVLSKRTRVLIEVRRRLLKIRKDKTFANDTLIRKMLNKSGVEIKKAIKRDKEKSDYFKTNEILTEKNMTSRWKKFKNYMEQENGVSRGIGEVTDENGLTHGDDKSKADAFADRLNACHSFPTGGSFNEDFRILVDEKMNEEELILVPDNYPQGDDSVPPITPYEVLENLRRTKSKSAPGPDSISYLMLKKGGASLINALCIVFNTLMLLGHFPAKWKEVKVSMLHKAGKNKSQVRNYRPISLSSCLGKLFESSIRLRFQAKLSRIRPENIFQSAYKSGRSTQENILKLVEDVVGSFNNKGCVISVYLDVAGAFDRVWQRGLLFKILSWGIGVKLARLVFSFLKNRSLVVNVGQEMSRKIYMEAGTPQGAVLSPILFNCYVDDLAKLMPKGICISQYADDVCLWLKSKDVKKGEKLMQEALDITGKWASKWRIKMEPSKSCSVLFTKCPSLKRQGIDLALDGTKIKQEEKVKFLGVTLDQNLTWKPYVDDLIRRANVRIFPLKKLAARNKWESPYELINLFDSLIKPLFDYGSPGMITMSNLQWRKLDCLQGKFLKAVCGLQSNCSTELLLDQLHMRKLSTEVKDQAARRMKSLCRTSPFGADWLSRAGFKMSENVIERVPSTSCEGPYASPVKELLIRQMGNERENDDEN